MILHLCQPRCLKKAFKLLLKSHSTPGCIGFFSLISTKEAHLMLDFCSCGPNGTPKKNNIDSECPSISGRKYQVLRADWCLTQVASSEPRFTRYWRGLKPLQNASVRLYTWCRKEARTRLHRWRTSTPSSVKRRPTGLERTPVTLLSSCSALPPSSRWLGSIWYGTTGVTASFLLLLRKSAERLHFASDFHRDAGATLHFTQSPLCYYVTRAGTSKQDIYLFSFIANIWQYVHGK